MVSFYDVIACCQLLKIEKKFLILKRSVIL